MLQEIRQFEDLLIEIVNSTNLNIEIKRLVVSDVLNLITREADKQIAQEIRDNSAEREYQDEQSVQPN